MQATLLTFKSRLEQLSSLTNSFQAQANIVNHSNKGRNSNTEANKTNGVAKVRTPEKDDHHVAVAEMDETTIIQCAKSAGRQDTQQHTATFDLTSPIWVQFQVLKLITTTNHTHLTLPLQTQ